MTPMINHIDDVLFVIKNNDNFSVNEKEDSYIVIDYILNTPDLFNNPIEKECRGIIFDKKTGKIISRPYHKFFNFGERPESSIENLDFSKEHQILEKLDGSMIRAFFVNGELIWGSKAGRTFLTPQIEKFVETHPQYEDIVRFFSDFTLIFEWCSRQNRIVLDYPEDRLVLTAIRHNTTGIYVNYNAMINVAKNYNVDYVKTETQNNISLLHHNAIGSIKQLSGIEGFVVRFNDGHMIKIKTDEYVLHHRAKDDINMEKNVVAILCNGTADDFRTLLDPRDRNRFEKFEKDFIYNIEETVAKYDYEIRLTEFKTMNDMTRKEYAVEWSIEKQHSKALKNIIFKDFDNLSILNKSVIKYTLLTLILSNCSSQTKVDSVRSLFGNINWYDYGWR